MNSRKTIIAAGLAGLLASSGAVGLGLGEIKQFSALNEPLVAEVELFGVGDLSQLEILANLGSRQDFAQAGVDREFFLADLKFAVDLSDKNRPLIRITSQKPVKEPYLDFLMEVQWPSGRLLREYTLLLDLPIFTEGSPRAKPVEAASTSRQPRPSTSGQSSASTERTTLPALSAGDSYRVQSGDTLWKIAQKARPSGTTLHQTMAAIHQGNPEAFINGDANLLKSGSVLRLPEGSDIASIDHQQALQQLQPSTSPTASVEEPVADTEVMLDASATDSDAAAQTAEEGRLKLTSALPDENISPSATSEAIDDSVTDQAGTSAEVAADVIQNDLTIVQEELDKTSRENAELRERLSQLEQQIATMQRLMELNDPNFAALQQQITAEGESDTPALQPESAEDDVASAEIAAGQPGVEKDTSSLLDWRHWLNILMYPLLALLAIILMIFLLFRNRGDEDDDDYLLRDEERFLKPGDEQETEEEENIDSLTPEELAIAESLGERLTRDEMSGLELNEGEEVDPLGEADIYLSLDDYGQAEDLLQSALEKEPDNTDLHLKLLEVYAASEAVDKFAAQKVSLDALGDPVASFKAQQLADELTGGAEQIRAEAEAANLDISGLATGPAADAPKGVHETAEDLPQAAEEAAAEGDEFDLELDLAGFGLDEESQPSEITSAEQGASEAPVTETEPDLDLDLELSDEPELDIDLGQTKPESAEAGQLEDITTEDFMADIDADLDMLSDSDECSTKLDLAEAFVEMGDREGAREILEEVLAEGNDEQKDRAKSLIDAIS